MSARSGSGVFVLLASFGALWVWASTGWIADALRAVFS